MILIAHRGNINGPEQFENHPSYIDAALDQGYDVEIDLWYIDGKYALGHDEPQYEIRAKYLSQKGLWIHCKHYDALQQLIPTNYNYFYHTDEDYVLTSHKYIWAYPGKHGNKYTICVMPEWDNYPTNGFAGVCSDYVGKINDQVNSVRP